MDWLVVESFQFLRMIVLIRSNDIYSDPRAMKYVSYFIESGIDYKLLGWNRNGDETNSPKAVFFRRQAGFNVGGLKAVLNRVRWMYFVLKTLCHIKDANVKIHACDLDTAFPAAVYKAFFNPKSTLIFDVFDWFSATLYNQKKYILKAFAWMEIFSVKHSDKIIICEPERRQQIPYSIDSDKLMVLPNIPYFSDASFLKRRLDCQFANDKLTFAYVGGFYGERCITEIIELAAEGVINLLIAGFGEESYVNRLAQLNSCPYIKYFGKVSYSEALSIMFNADVIYAMYAPTNPNHVYAAPNKYYETMFLGKPIFSTRGTILESKVETTGIGFLSYADKNSIAKEIQAIDTETIHKKGQKARLLWDTKYCNYTYSFLHNVYSKIVN